MRVLEVLKMYSVFRQNFVLLVVWFVSVGFIAYFCIKLIEFCGIFGSHGGEVGSVLGFWRRVDSSVDASVSEKHTVSIFRAFVEFHVPAGLLHSCPEWEATLMARRSGFHVLRTKQKKRLMFSSLLDG
jgi:hypothetical protein